MNEQNEPQYISNNILPTSTLANVSLVAGILGFTLFPIVSTVVALVTGYMARKETRSIPPTASGDGLATAGIIMGYVQIGLIVISVCCFAAYFVFIGGLVLTNQS